MANGINVPGLMMEHRLDLKVDEECKIDSISQSWSVLSGAGNDSLVNTAMESAYKNLVQKDVGIIQLLEPAFDKSAFESRLHKRICARRKRKWRTIHACCRMDDHGVCQIG